jgi:hypothetical protein
VLIHNIHDTSLKKQWRFQCTSHELVLKEISDYEVASNSTDEDEISKTTYERTHRTNRPSFVALSRNPFLQGTNSA